MRFLKTSRGFLLYHSTAFKTYTSAVIEKKGQTMKQDIFIFSSRIDSSRSVYAALAEHDIPAIIITDKQELLPMLYDHTPAFLWLDLNTNEARLFLTEIMDRTLHPPPYIILTSKFLGSADRADMLNLGADVCVEDPASLTEMVAIISAVLRREGRIRCVSTGSLLPCVRYKELFIDPLRHIAEMQGQAIHLTPTEFDLLYLLASNPGVVFPREQIYTQIWGVEDKLGLSSVSDHISALRQKLGLHPRDNKYIQTVYRIGYRFADAT